MGDTCPLPLSATLHAEESLQSVVDRWAAQPEAHALWHPPECLALQLARFEERGEDSIKVHTSIVLNRQILMPCFVAADCHQQRIAYILRAAVVHVRNTLTEGHYRAALYDDARILYTDDNKVATVTTRNNLKEISSNAYVLYLTRV